MFGDIISGWRWHIGAIFTQRRTRFPTRNPVHATEP